MVARKAVTNPNTEDSKTSVLKHLAAPHCMYGVRKDGTPRNQGGGGRHSVYKSEVRNYSQKNWGERLYPNLNTVYKEFPLQKLLKY